MGGNFNLRPNDSFGEQFLLMGLKLRRAFRSNKSPVGQIIRAFLRVTKLLSPMMELELTWNG